MPYKLEPEVAGELHENTVMNGNVHPPVILKLHLELSGWLEDDLMETFPCYVVTDRLRDLIERIGATGIDFDVVQVSLSNEFRELYPERALPKLHWLRVTGNLGADDFSISDDHCLVVSERLFMLMKKEVRLSHCDCERC